MKHLREAFFVGAVFLVALLGRLHALGLTPAWDFDEGYNVNIAQQLQIGHFAMFGLRQAFVQHPPLFFLMLAAIPGPPTVDRARLTAVVVSSLAVIALYLLARRTLGSLAASFAVAGYAVMSFSVVETRFGYTYSLLTFLLPAYLWLQLGSNSSRAFRIARVIVGAAAALTDHIAWPVILGGLLLDGERCLRSRITELGAILGVVVLVWVPIFARDPSLFVSDFVTTFVRVGGSGLPLPVRVLVGMQGLATLNAYCALGLAGLLAIRAVGERGGQNDTSDFTADARRSAGRVVLVIWLMIACSLAIRDVRIYFRSAVPLLPFLAYGIGALGALAWKRTCLPVEQILVRGGLIILLLWEGIFTFQMAGTHLPTTLDWLIGNDTGEARAVVTTINQSVRPGDQVIADAQIGWAIHASVADWAQLSAATGVQTAFYPANIPPERWEFRPSLARARFAVLDPLTDAWLEQDPHSDVAREITQVRDTWCLVDRRGGYRVYRRCSPS